MELSPESTQPIVNRLKRARGQLEGILRMLDEGRDREDIVTQLAAVSKAIDRAGFSLVATGLKQCMLDPDNEFDTAKMEKLFLSLA